MRLILILGFVLALVAGLAVTAPTRLVYDALAPSGVEAGLVQGSVWRGQALRVRLGGRVVQQVETGLEPASLLALSPAMSMRVTDPEIQIDARLRAAGDAIRIEEAQGLVSVRALPLLAGLPTPADSFARLDGVSVSLDQAGRCISAEGAVMSPALADAGARYAVALPILDMSVFCAGDVLALNLSGQSPAVDLEGVIRLDAQAPSYRIVATPHDPEGGRVLSLMGFRADGARWIADSEEMGEG